MFISDHNVENIISRFNGNISKEGSNIRGCHVLVPHVDVEVTGPDFVVWITS